MVNFFECVEKFVESKAWSIGYWVCPDFNLSLCLEISGIGLLNAGIAEHMHVVLDDMWQGPHYLGVWGKFQRRKIYIG